MTTVSSPQQAKPMVLSLVLALSLLLTIFVATSNPASAAAANAAITLKASIRSKDKSSFVQQEEVNQKLHEATSRLRRVDRTIEDRYRQLAGEIDATNATNATSALTPLPPTSTVSPFFQFETHKWTQRNILSDLELDLETFRVSLEEASRNQCEMGITATLFDADGEQILQETVGSNYHDLSSPTKPWTSGWTGETEFALYSNSKIFATVLYMASVVETGLGYLDEPVFTTFGLTEGEEDIAGDGGSSSYVLTAANISGRITPRMILSHQTGIQAYDRNDPIQDPLYSCIGNDNTTLGSCVRSYLLSDDAIATMPGSVMRYSNDPFYILAELMVLKTGASDIQELMDIYINEPLGINATYDCPLVGSTPSKPHVSWGICSTGRDVPKLIQELAITHNMIGRSNMDSDGNGNTATVSPVGILSPSSVREILNFQGEFASNSDEPLPFNMPLSNCLARTGDTEINFLMGYGLGTMITPGVKGLLFVHAATVGGYWVVSPGKYSAYFAFMKQGAFPSAYIWIARIIDKFERASTVRVRNSWDVVDVNLDGTTTNTTTTTTTSFFNEITPCVDGMFIDTTTIDDNAEEWVGCPTPVPVK
mmetsp:Transcript_40278/g.97290  ORF Transcript_40278/g.97290 Transcript_40278/m.97290 type:complete len:596 (-) Transcript_40278:279-2066(-)